MSETGDLMGFPVTPTAIQQQVPTPNEPRGSRLAWLDALRGIAALAVFSDHLTYYMLVKARTTVFAHFYPGWFGVALFFLVSGYIIPASLERRGSLRGFWLSRIFRLYPLWAVAVGAMVVLSATNLLKDGRFETAHPLRATLGHLTMLQNLIGQRAVMQPLWTLSFEMVFYLIVSASFVAGWHRRSSLWALAFIGGTVGLGLFVQPASAVVSAHPRATAYAVAGAFALAITGFLAGERWTVIVGALTACGLSAGLLATNSVLGDWRNLGVLALMFTGTVMYRAERGTISWRWAGTVATTVVVLLSIVMALPAYQWFEDHVGVTPRWSWTTATLLSGAMFGIALYLRPQRVPRVAAWLGQISYSVYLLHHVLIYILLSVIPAPSDLPVPVQVLLTLALLATTLTLSHLTYRWIEEPFQQWGRRVTKLAERRFGPDTRVSPGRRITEPTTGDSHAAP